MYIFSCCSCLKGYQENSLLFFFNLSIQTIVYVANCLLSIFADVNVNAVLGHYYKAGLMVSDVK